METIYLIYDNPSDYESWPSVIGFTLTEEAAKEKVEELTKEYIEANEWIEKMHAKRKEFRDSIPELEYEKDLKIPRWPAGMKQEDITVEMRKERENIQGKNEMINSRNSKRYNERHKAENEYVTELWNSIPKNLESYFDKDTMRGIHYTLYDDSPFYSEILKKL